MSKFMLTIDSMGLARQISALINSSGQLRMRLTPHTVLSNAVHYIVELAGERVIGVVGIEAVRHNVSEIKHLCVDLQFRGHRLGQKLLRKAIAAASTRFVYGLVRSDNAVNIHNNLVLGMSPIGKTNVNNRPYYMIVFAKQKNAPRRVDNNG